MRTFALAVVVVSVLSRSAAAQTLAEAARRAEDARKTAPGVSRVFTNKNPSGNFSNDGDKIGNHELTLRNFKAFMNTRRAYARMLVADAALRSRMQVRLASAKTIDAAVGAWDGEPEVLALISGNGTTPREFLLTEVAVAQAAIVMQSMAANTVTEPLPPIVEKNVQFVKAHWTVLEAFSKEVMAIAGHLQ
jgi:hypothetical protein